ncbi:MAG TPA: alcohol dehydrogenase catalytic domain-containing protein, partial [Mycobacteriales bacterium]
MRAIQIIDLTGPEHALQLVEVPEPRVSDMGAETVVVDVHAAGVSFPELLQTRGMYQVQPSLPFIPGSEVAGVVRSAPVSSPLRPGDRVAALCGIGGFAD